MRPAPDTTLGDGRYRLQERLGAGGMASVWLGIDERLGRPVAVKIVADTLAGDEQWVRRFNREARAAASLSHRGVVSVFDYGVEDGRPYLVMEYVPGGTLAQRLGANGEPANGALPDPEAVAEELLDALAAVHAAGILHRDIKPANLLLDEHGYVRLTDFGIAQPEDASALTQPGLVVGTLRYLAPEVAAGHPASVQSDLYAVGVVLRQLSGRRVSPRMARLITALTAEAASSRPSSAGEALALLGPRPDRPRPRMTPEPATVPGPTEPLDAPAGGTEPTRVQPRQKTATRIAPTPTPSYLHDELRGFELSAFADGLRELAHDARVAARRGHQRVEPELRRRGIAPALAYGVAGVIVLVLIIVIASTGGSSPVPARSRSHTTSTRTSAAQSESSVPSPAPASASVSQQVQGLDAIIQAASRH